MEMTCECSDAGCPVHKGAAECEKNATVTLYRVDMEDRTGVDCCEGCADDALDSGVFTTRDDDDDE